MNITACQFALSLFALFFTFLPSLAAPGDLDTTFGGTGKIRIGLGFGSNRAHAVAAQPDGKIVAVGQTYSGGYEQVAVVRYNADGTLDLTFGTGGIVITDGGSPRSSASGVAIQPDGKIVVSGYSTIGLNYFFALIRYNPNGSLDTSFSDDGKLITSLRTSNERFTDVAIQPDGKIVAVGFEAANQSQFAVLRVNSDGAFDADFGNNGVASAFSNFNDQANAVTLQPDGKIIAAGQSLSDFAVARFNPDGSLDTSFSGDGVVTTSSSSSSDLAYDVALQADGKIVISGTSVLFLPPPENSVRTDFAVVRYNPDGSPDSTFDGDGVKTHFFRSGDNRNYSLAVQPDGKIVTAGYSCPRGSIQPFEFALVRYNPDGSLDETFDGDGIVTTSVGGTFSRAFGMALQSGGKIVAAGFNNAESGDVALARYNANGSLDTGFGAGGIVSTDFGDSRSAAFATVIQPDRKILVAGYNRQGFALARFNPNGTLDATFGSNGIVKTPHALEVNIIHAIALQPDGKIVVAGASTTPPLTNARGFAVARYNPNGSLDTSFDGDGIVITRLGTEGSEAHAVAIQPDGKIVAAGRSRFDFALIRYHSNGSLDTSFDGDGIVTTDMGDVGDTINAVALQTDGKIVAAGFKAEDDTNSRDSAVARYNPDGSLDTSFSGDGKVVTPIWTSGNDDANGLVIQPDGKIITAGQAVTSNFVFALVRYNPDGTLDNTFDSDGIVMTGFSANGGFATAVALQPDGKIVAAGNNGHYLVADFALVRYNPNGSLDNSFGSGGKSIFDIAFEDNVYALALDNLGRMVVAGASGDLFTVTRVVGDAAPSRAMFDYDGDGKSDISVFRPSAGDWYISRSSDGAFSGIHFGADGDLIAPADFDGDGKTDIAVFRPSAGSWYRLNSSDNSFTAIQFGAAGDLPVPGDYDGDRRADISIYRPSAGAWYRLNSSNNQSVGVQFGIAEDKPLVGDFDGDGKSDLAVFRPSNGTWYRINSSNDTFSPNQFGIAEDKPVPADYDGDGKTDLAVYRPSVGDWYLINSSNNSFSGIHFGITEDKPAPADYDGDGKADFGVFRPSNGSWYLLRTTAGFTGFQFGANGDIPTPNAFIR